MANVTAGQVDTLSAALSAKIGVDDEAIAAGQNMLLTFTQVRNEVGKGNDIFTQATRTVQDMAATFGGDAVSNSKILGKALNDPVKGVSALTRVGVSFTQAQKDQIATLVESGNVMGAQKVILGELAKQTKGSAAAQATAGDKARVALDNLKETIGTALLPVIDRLATIFTTKIAPAITTFVGQLQSGTGAGGLVASTFATVGSVLSTVFGFISANKEAVAAFFTIIGTGVLVSKAFAAAQLLVNIALSANPIGIVVLAIAALVAGLIYAYKNSETFRKVVDTAFKGIKKVVSAVIGFIVPFVKNHWGLLVSIIGGPIGIVVVQVIKHFDTIKKVVKFAIDFVVAQAKGVAKFASLVGEHIGKVVKFFRELPGKIKAFLTGLPAELKKLGGDIIQGLVNGIKAAAHYVTDAVNKIINAIPKKIRDLMHIGSPSKVTEALGGYIGDGLAKGIADSAPKVGEAVDKVGKKLKEKIAKLRDSLSGLRSDFASLVEPIASNFTQGLFDFDTAALFTANLASTKAMLSTLIANFTKLKNQGLSPGFLYQLFQSGGPALINSLAGLDAASANGAASLFGEVTSLSNQLGTAVAGATDKGAALETQTVRLERKLDKLIKSGQENADKIAEAVTHPAKRARRRAVRA